MRPITKHLLSHLKPAMKFTASALALLATATAHTQEEINKKGAEVMEEYRRDRGHWIHLSDMTHIDHMCG